MIEMYTVQDFAVLIVVGTLLTTVALLGMIVGCAAAALKVSAEHQVPQVLREACLAVLVAFNSIVLWWDLFHAQQFPLNVRLVVSGIALVLGNAAYAMISADLKYRYRGIRTFKHDMANLQHVNLLLQESEEILRDRVKALEADNAILRRELGRTF